ELLAAVAPDVVERVLAHNRRQSRALGVEQLRSRQRPEDFLDLQGVLERTASLDRAAAALPDAGALQARRALAPGYTRPELAVLSGRVKIQLQGTLLAGTLPDEPLLQPY